MTGSEHAPKVPLMRPQPNPDLPVASRWLRHGHDPAARPGSPAVDGYRPIALVVDDEPMVGELMAMALGTQGWRTLVARAAEEAAAHARNHAIDLLVTDLHLPGMSGLDLATHLRERRADLPVVLVSGWSEAAALELAQPFAFLRKPVPLREALRAIAAMTPSHRG